MKRFALVQTTAVVFGLVATADSAELFSKTGSTAEKFIVTEQYASKLNASRYRSGHHDLPSYRGTYRGRYLEMARGAAHRHGVPEDLFLRLIQQESGWRANAESPKGAYGLTQLMPATARELRVNRSDPYANLDGGARYLRQQYDRFRDWRLALAAYNAGPEKVRKYNGIPPYRETQNYVRSIMGN